jgi:hypothetical protein
MATFLARCKQDYKEFKKGMYYPVIRQNIFSKEYELYKVYFDADYEDYYYFRCGIGVDYEPLLYDYFCTKEEERKEKISSVLYYRVIL